MKLFNWKFTIDASDNETSSGVGATIIFTTVIVKLACWTLVNYNRPQYKTVAYLPQWSACLEGTVKVRKCVFKHTSLLG